MSHVIVTTLQAQLTHVAPHVLVRLAADPLSSRRKLDFQLFLSLAERRSQSGARDTWRCASRSLALRTPLVVALLVFYVLYTMINFVYDTIVILCLIVLPPPHIVVTHDIIIDYILVININRTTAYKGSPPPPPYEMFLMFQYSNTHTMLYNMCYYISFLQALARW
jgi:hypothetical protein